jgi:cytochrome P450
MGATPHEPAKSVAAMVGPDFDHHSREFASSRLELYRHLHEQCPVVRSERYGGFRMFSRYEDVSKIARDWETFSSDHDVDGTASGGGGIIIPPIPVRFSFLEMDPPVHRQLRKTLSQWMAPARIVAYEDRMRELVVAQLERCKAMGEFDVIDDLANPLTAILTLDFAGMPTEDWRVYLHPVHENAYIDRTSREFDRVLADIAKGREHTKRFIAKRRALPADDLTTQLIELELDDVPLTDDEIVDYLWMFMGGGFDTTSGAIAYSMIHLTENLDDRRQLLADPELLPTAVEEFVRHFAPATSVARTVTKPVTIAGDQMLPGDRVLVCYGAANHDPDKFEAPDEVQLDRSPNRHLGWGDGVHRCAGMRFARTEMRIFYEELLGRMPNFAVRPEEAVEFPSVAVSAGFVSLPAVADATGAVQ